MKIVNHMKVREGESEWGGKRSRMRESKLKKTDVEERAHPAKDLLVRCEWKAKNCLDTRGKIAFHHRDDSF